MEAKSKTMGCWVVSAEASCAFPGSPFFECLPHTHAHNLKAHGTGEAGTEATFNRDTPRAPGRLGHAHAQPRVAQLAPWPWLARLALHVYNLPEEDCEAVCCRTMEEGIIRTSVPIREYCTNG